MTDEQAVAQLLDALGYRFRDPTLLRDALTHRSFANEKPDAAPRDNERLEFLGDAVLGLVVASMLFEEFPDAPEGELTRRRADLVCERGLTEVATAIGLGAALRLGKGEDRSGGRDKPRLLASAFEACVGAVYLDGGAPEAFDVVQRLFRDHLDPGSPGAHDHKSRLQELVQVGGGVAPVYEVVGTEGPDHELSFSVAILLDGVELGRGGGRSKLEAEQQAARAAVARILAERPEPDAPPTSPREP